MARGPWRAGGPRVSRWPGLPLRAGTPRKPIFSVARFPGLTWAKEENKQKLVQVSPLLPSGMNRALGTSSEGTARGWAPRPGGQKGLCEPQVAEGAPLLLDGTAVRGHWRGALKGR